MEDIIEEAGMGLLSLLSATALTALYAQMLRDGGLIGNYISLFLERICGS